MSELEIIVSTGHGPAFRLCMNPGKQSDLDAVLVARRDNKRLKLSIENPEILDRAAKALVERDWRGRSSIVLKAGTIRGARIL